MKVRDTGSDVTFDPAPTGNHIARCIQVIDLGTHHEEMYNKDKHQLFMMWELPHEMKTYTKKGENGAPDEEVTEPFTVSKWYNATLADGSHLRNDLESWRGRAFTDDELEEFDLQKILGVPCMINVIHKAKKRGNGVNALVSSVTPMPKGLECPPRVHDIKHFSLEEFKQDEFEALSKGLRNTVEQSQEYKAMMDPNAGQTPAPQSENPAPSTEQFDDIPF